MQQSVMCGAPSVCGVTQAWADDSSASFIMWLPYCPSCRHASQWEEEKEQQSRLDVSS